MIRDAEFWMEARRKHDGGDAIFCAMLPLLHARQMALDSGVEVDEDNIGNSSNSLPSMLKNKSNEPFEENKVLRLPNSNFPGKPVSTSVIRILQQIMMFAVPLYSLRYNIPAMSMSWKTSCLVDRGTKQLITFGAGEGVKVPQHLRCRGCVAADDFFAILTDHDEVWASGGLNILSYENGNSSLSPLGKEDTMTNIAGKALMLVGHGARLACVTRAFTVRPLSALSNPVRSIIPSRHIRFLDMGYGEDFFMIGTDSVMYKTVASKRTLGTPRRVMALSRTAISRVASGMGFYLIIDQNGHLLTLGRNKKGQLGNGQQQNVRRKPYLQKSLCHHFFVMIAAGDSHSLALTSSGIVYGAGNNSQGQLGLGPTITEVLNFTPIPLPSKCIGIAAGPAGSMFACEDGRVYVCGLNDNRQLGLEVTERIVSNILPIPSVITGVEAYTMDFGVYRKPLALTSSTLATATVPEPTAASSRQHSMSALHPTSPLIEQRRQESTILQDLSAPIPADSAKSEVLTHPVLIDELSGRQFKQKKKATCVKCCSVM